MSGLTVPGIPEAPATGAPYVRNNAAWQRTFVSSGYVSGHWYPADKMLTLQAGTTNSASTIAFAPLVIYQDVTITDLAAEVTTGVASSNFQLAIYAADPTSKLPTGAALATTASMSGVTATTVSSTLGTPVTLPAGMYWAAQNTDTTGIAFRAVSTSEGWVTGYVGSVTLANVLRAAPGQLYYSLAQTFGTWPTVSTVTEQSSVNRGPVIAYKAQ